MVGWLWDRWAASARPAALQRYGWVWAALAAGLAGVILLPLRLPPEWAVLVPPTLAQKLAVVGLLLAGALLVIAAARAGRALAMFAAVFVPVALMLAFETHVAVAGHNRVFDIKSSRSGWPRGPPPRTSSSRTGTTPCRFSSTRAARSPEYKTPPIW